MLILLTPTQVAKHWSLLKEKVVAYGPPTCDGSDYTKVLEGVLGGMLQVWAAVEGDTLVGFVITQMLFDPFSMSRSLLLFAIFSVDGVVVPPSIWRDGYSTLLAYARAKGCARVTAYIGDERLVRLANRLGMDTKYTYATLEV